MVKKLCKRHKWTKRGTTTDGRQRWECSRCEITKTDDPKAGGRPSKSDKEAKLSGTTFHPRAAVSKYDAAFPHIPGNSKAEQCIYFIETYCVHSRGKWTGKPFILNGWQREVIQELFDGNFKKAYISMARKNGKSLLIACIGLFLLVLDDEGGKEIYTAAASHEQASLIYEMIVFSVRQNDALNASLKLLPSIKKIIYLAGNSFLRAISSESKTAHGFNSYAVICDELHAWPDRALFDVLETSFGVRDNPLMVSITTAGFDKLSLCRELYDYGKQVESGVIDDPTFYFKCYELDEKDDWKDESNWIKANPGLGDFRLLKEMQEMFVKAKALPSFENSFKRLYLNMWTSQDVRWLPVELWDRCNEVVDIEKLKGCPCYAGFDLSSTTALTALSLIFPPQNEDEKYDLLTYFWVPEENLAEKAKQDHAPYELWVKQGLIYSCPGPVINYEWMRKKLGELATEYEIKEIAFDPWNATLFAGELTDDGFTLVDTQQGFRTLSAPSKELEKIMLSRRFRHGGNPVLRWMVDNTVITMDPAGNIKPDKAKSVSRIDGVISTIMALDRASRTVDPTSVYATGKWQDFVVGLPEQPIKREEAITQANPVEMLEPIEPYEAMLARRYERVE